MPDSAGPARDQDADLISVEEATHIARVAYQTIRQWIAYRKLKSYRVARNRLRVSRAEVEAITSKRADPDLLTPKAVAALLGVSLESVYVWIRTGKLAHQRLSSREIRIRRVDVDALRDKRAKP